MPTIGNISLAQARALAREYRIHHGNSAVTDFHFIPREFLQLIAGVPGVDGVKLYFGQTPSPEPKEVLMMVPAYIANRGGGNENWIDILEYEYLINRDQKEAAVTQRFTDTIFLLSGPCPPPPSGYTSGRLD
jgi:hypothetical protein